MADPIIAVICLVLIIYICVQSAICWESTQNILSTTTDQNANSITIFLNEFESRLNTNPLSFAWTEYSQQILLYGLLIWFIGVAYYFTTRKNYIAGKEFGTSKWGTINDIKELFAENVMKTEIKKAKKVRFFITRFFVKRKILKECKKTEKTYLTKKKYLLKEQTENAKEYKKKLNEAREEVKRTAAIFKKEAWEPYQYEDDLKVRLDGLETELYSDTEKMIARRKAKKEYRKKVHQFYRGKGKIKKIKMKYKDADMLLTKTERISMHNFKLNNNTLIIGGSGSLKTRGYVIPNLLQAHSSFIVTDPKGEILEKIGYFLQEIQGYKVRVLNLNQKHLSGGYNPFVYIHPERDGYEERVLTLIETLIINTNGGEKKENTDPLWPNGERMFLQALFFFTVDGFVEEERNMDTVLDLMGMLQIEEEQDNYDSDLDYFVEIFEREHGKDHIGVQQYHEFREKAPGKTAKSIIISVTARLAPFRTKAIREMFSYDAMEMDRVGEEKTAIFVVVPPTDSTFNFIAGMFYTQLFQELEYCATQVHKHEGQRLPFPCRFILDEFANTCTIPNFVKILAYARSFGIGITPILQSLEQIKKMYKDEWGVIVDNCNTLLFLGSITHEDTLEYMSKLLGKGTFDKRTTGRTRGRQGTSSQNWDVVGRELMDPSEIRKLPKEKCLLIVGGKDPFYSDKYDLKTHPNYCLTSEANSAYAYQFNPPGKQPTAQKVIADSPHGEDKLKPSKNAVVSVEEIKIDFSLQNMIKRIGNHFENHTIVPDEEMIVDDGEDIILTKEERMQLFKNLIAEDIKIEDEINQIFSSETVAFMGNLEKDKIMMDQNPVHLVNRLIKTAENLVPALDEEMIVDDGEPSRIEEQVMDYILEDDISLEGELDNLGNELDELLDIAKMIEEDTLFQSEIETETGT